MSTRLTKGRLGEVKGLRIGYSGVKDKLAQIDSTLPRTTPATGPGMPTFGSISGEVLPHENQVHRACVDMRSCGWIRNNALGWNKSETTSPTGSAKLSERDGSARSKACK